MSIDPNTSKHRFRDGASQRQRMLQALHPDYIHIDERSPEDLLAFARALAAEINYYHEENPEVPEGNWEGFFTDDIPESAPHHALFLTFVKLFGYAQQHLNTITKRHLDFYYHQVLQLKENPPQPDQVHVLFQLAKNLKQHLVKAGTLLKAGKDKNGAPLYYATEKDIVINKATITSLKNIVIDKENTPPEIRAIPVADSADGLGTPFEDENVQWEIFGDPAAGTQAAIGFAIASPLLFLKEGFRTIEVSLNCDATLPGAITGAQPMDMADTFEVMLSGAETWIKGTVSAIERGATAQRDALANTQFGFNVALDTTQPAVSSYNKEVLEGGYKTGWPVMRVLMKNHAGYELLRGLKLTGITLRIQVNGVKELLLRNDHGALDPAKPFPPFGGQPKPGASFYIGHGEAFQKKLDSLALDIAWQDLPEDFTGHYEAYGAVTEADFTATLNLLYQNSWAAELSPAYALFGDPQEISGIPAMLQNQGIAYQHHPSPQPLRTYDPSVQNGFIRMRLSGPVTPFKAFGHGFYSNLYTQQAIALSKYDVDPSDPDYDPPELPTTPYTPMIQSLTLNYSATQDIDLQAGQADPTGQFFYMEAFGHSEWLSGIPGEKPALLPQYTDEGTLYIGISALEPPQQLSMLFRPAEGSAAPDSSIRREDIRWSYLSGTQWIPFKAQQLLSDTARGFQDTGIITFNIPRNASLEHSLMPQGLHWIKAAVESGAKGAGKLVVLSTQAVTAAFTDRNNDPARLSEALPPESISGLLKRQSAVKGVLQPYSSFNGKSAEQSDAFYTRISERLRHKARSISGWDYERLVLERFPSVYKLKCLNHTLVDTENGTGTSENKAGHVTLITLPGPGNKNAADPLEPKTPNKTLAAIGDYIQKYTSPFVSVAVRNPRYERLQLRFKVRFAEGVDRGYHQKLLEEELVHFLSPWAYEDEEDIIFGNTIYKSAALDFVEKRPYVDFVTDFVLYHIFEAQLPAETMGDPVDAAQHVYRIVQHYPNANEPQIVLDFIAGFDEAIAIQENPNVNNIQDFLPVFHDHIHGIFQNLPPEKPLGDVQRATVMSHIENYDEVAFVRDFRLFHVDGAMLKEDTEKAVAVHPAAILTADAIQEITLIEAGEYQCPGVETIGIDYIVVEGDFEVE